MMRPPRGEVLEMEEVEVDSEEAVVVVVLTKNLVLDEAVYNEKMIYVQGNGSIVLRYYPSVALNFSLKGRKGINHDFMVVLKIQFHRLNIKQDSRLGLIKMSDMTINLAAICTPADYNTRPLDTIYSNFIDALPVVKYCSENNKRLIHFSTCEVYGKTIGSFLPKDSPLRQDPAYYVLKEGDTSCIFGSIEKHGGGGGWGTAGGGGSGSDGGWGTAGGGGSGSDGGWGTAGGGGSGSAGGWGTAVGGGSGSDGGWGTVGGGGSGSDGGLGTVGGGDSGSAGGWGTAGGGSDGGWGTAGGGGSGSDGGWGTAGGGGSRSAGGWGTAGGGGSGSAGGWGTVGGGGSGSAGGWGIAGGGGSGSDGGGTAGGGSTTGGGGSTTGGGSTGGSSNVIHLEEHLSKQPLCE
ncbi:hypothetical protein ACFE04_005282 [Oxalis oulophora]